MLGPNCLETLFGTTSPVAIVTGSGAPRIGQTIARALAERGFRLIVHANKSIDQARAFSKQLNERGSESMAIQADLRDQKQVRFLVDEAYDRLGRIDVLVNSAAVWKPRTLEGLTAEEVSADFEINARGTFLCCQHVGLRMARQPMGGAIVNIGDWATARPYLDHASYFVSKGAIPTLTRDFAVELASRNPRIRVNAVLPGPVMLPPDATDQERQTAIETTLVHRVGDPLNVAHAVIFLIENDFVTGACVPVDGGRSIFAPWTGSRDLG